MTSTQPALIARLDGMLATAAQSWTKTQLQKLIPAKPWTGSQWETWRRPLVDKSGKMVRSKLVIARYALDVPIVEAGPAKAPPVVVKPIEPVPSPVPTPPSGGLPFDPFIAIPQAATPWPYDKRLPFKVGGVSAQVQSAQLPHSVNILSRDGWDVVEFDCRPGDRRPKASEKDRAIDRCELQFEYEFKAGRRYRRHFKVMLFDGPTLTGDNLKFAQDHNVNDPGDSSLGPVIALQLWGEHLKIVKRTDPAPATKTRVKDDWQYGGDEKKPGLRIQRGHVYDVEIEHVIDWRPLSDGGKGMLKITVDGVVLVDVKTPLGYNDAKGPYPKLGFYRPTDSNASVKGRYFLPSTGFIEDLGPA